MERFDKSRERVDRLLEASTLLMMHNMMQQIGGSIPVDFAALMRPHNA